MRARALTLALTAALAAACGSGKEAGRHYEEAGGYSIVPPPGWTVSEFPGLKYEIISGPAQNGFAPNINVVDESFRGSLDEYVKANLETMRKVFKSFDELSREDVQLASGERAVMVVTTNVQQEMQLQQTFYFVGEGRRKYVLTCT